MQRKKYYLVEISKGNKSIKGIMLNADKPFMIACEKTADQFFNTHTKIIDKLDMRTKHAKILQKLYRYISIYDYLTLAEY